jgi:tetratricopeptide (TPR) repeat protein
VRRSRNVLVAALLLLACGCGPKTTAPVTTPNSPRFPDFVFPAAPAGSAPQAVLDQHQAAWRLLQSGDARAAERSYNVALKSLPGFYPAEAGLGYAALARRDAQAAITHFDRALGRDAGYAPALAGKGDALLLLGKTEAALETFQAALSADPGLTGLRSRIDVLKFHSVQQDIAAARKAADSGQTTEARRAYQAAIAASPESAFLYRELALVDRKAGDMDAALRHARQAVELDPADARSQELVGEIYEGQRAWAQAADAYAAAQAVDPSDALAARIDDMREKAAFDAMPEEFRTIGTAPVITRAQLAALLAVRLGDLLRGARSTTGVVITDTRSNWAAPWILTVARAGVMEPFANHTFQPGASVRRGDLAQAVSRVLALVAADKPKLAAKWRDPRPRFPDLSPSHLSYPAAARAVSSGVLDMLEGGTFQLSRPVSGAEALQAVTRLEALAKGTTK